MAAVSPHPHRMYLGDPPEGMVDLATIPYVRMDIRFHSDRNATGAPIPGYGAPGAWLNEDAATALAEVAEVLADENVGLLIYEGFRPYRATLARVAWARRASRPDLITTGRIARRSAHNRGDTVALTLVHLDSGVPFDMGTDYDELIPRSTAKNAVWPILDNRMMLRAYMRLYGFQGSKHSWWEYTYDKGEPSNPNDIPYGCFEPLDGEWRPPRDWNRAQWKQPKFAYAPCDRGGSLSAPDTDGSGEDDPPDAQTK
jgi:zinc D-Ala-D-Ala dipeptidase